MSMMYGVLRLLSSEADAGRPAAGHWLPTPNLVFPLSHKLTTLGRDLHNAIVLFDSSIAPEHAKLKYEHGHWLLTNVSEDGLLVIGDKSLESGESAIVTPGQTVLIGTMQLQIVAPELPAQFRSLKGRPGASSPASLLLTPPMPPYNWRWLVVIALVMAIGLAFAALLIAFSMIFTYHALLGSKGNLITAIIIPLLPVLGVLVVVMFIDRYERNAWYVLLGAFLWGLLVAIPSVRIEASLPNAVSMLNLESLPGVWLDTINNALVGFGVGLTEEVLKGAGLLALMTILRHRIHNVVDGVLYGAVIGAGFALIENVKYFADTDSSLSLGFISLIVGRIVLGWLVHSTFTACFGAALGIAHEHRYQRPWWHVPVGGFLLAVILHGFFDFVTFQAGSIATLYKGSSFITALSLFAIIANYIPLFVVQGVLYIMLMRALAREAGILRTYLADEVQRGMVTPEEYIILQRASLRQRLQRALFITQNFRLWIAVRNLYAAEVSLAFAKWRMVQGIGNGATITHIDHARACIRDYHRIIARLEHQPVLPQGTPGYGTRSRKT